MQIPKKTICTYSFKFFSGHRFAATWTGDNNSTMKHLKQSIPMSLNLSLSGQPFNGPDMRWVCRKC